MKLRTLNDILLPRAPRTAEEAEANRAAVVDTIRFASSIDLLQHDAPLDPVIFDTRVYDGFVVEKVIFRSLPGFYVTGNLYRPADTTKKYPAVLQPHGHWQHGRIETVDRARIPQRCANFALRGMVAFIYDMIGYCDSQQVPHKGFDPAWEDWNYGRFSLQLNNSLKAVDFVSSLPYVDADRIGCTGCSGGGTQTYFLSAIDPRIKAAAPINMASTRMQGGCICENTAFLRTDLCNMDVTAAIAPRPLFLSGSDGDWTVTSQTVEFPAMERIWALYGAGKAFEHFYQHAPHTYNLPIRERVYDFFCRRFGIPNPFPREIDMEFDTSSLLIGNIRPYVPAEGFIENDEELFTLARGIMEKNLAALPEADRAALARRVYLIDRAFPLDVAWAVENEGDPVPVVVLGECPPADELPFVQYPHTYNFAADSRRVSALAALFAQYPQGVFRASGKTAALCARAARFVPGVRLELTAPDDSRVVIPGEALVRCADRR